MGLLGNLLTRRPVSLSAFGTDIFENSVIAAYLNAREHEIYIRSLWHIEDKRNCSNEAIKAIEGLLVFSGTDDAVQILDDVIFSEKKRNLRSQDRSATSQIC